LLMLYSTIGLLGFIVVFFGLIINPALVIKIKNLKRKALLSITTLLESKSEEAKKILKDKKNIERNLPKVSKILEDLQNQFERKTDYFNDINLRNSTGLSSLFLLINLGAIIFVQLLSSPEYKLISIILFLSGFYYAAKTLVYWIEIGE